MNKNLKAGDTVRMTSAPSGYEWMLGVNFVIASVYGGKATIKEMDSNGMRWTLELKDLKAA